MSNAFRPEIAGLRAIAVAGVVLFHLKVAGFQGGFVGVDVFFVISGYLISRNILCEIGGGRFSFGDFYLRRGRRIYPAMIFTVLATYLAAALWCAPQMFLDLAKESTHAILSISNIQYWRESRQYFAADAEHLALLHCWSLSLEEQFYLLWPALLVVAAKSGRPFAVIALVGAASLGLAIVAGAADPAAAFYLTPFRIFEFAIGSLVLAAERAIPRTGMRSEMLSAFGLVLIAASAVLFRSDMPEAAAASLLPCLGAGFVIWSGAKTAAAVILTHRAAIALGAISYSLYLCHWPIIFFGRFIFGEAAETAPALLIMLAVMIAVASAMHWAIERPFLAGPRSASLSLRRNALGFASVIVMIAAVTHLTFVQRGFARQLPQEQAEFVRLQSPAYVFDGLENKGPIGFILVGDSFASQYVAGLAPLMGELNVAANVQAFPGCPVLYTTFQAAGSSECQAWHDQALAEIERNPDLPVILAQRWENYTGGRDYLFATQGGGTTFERLQHALEVTLERLTRSGRRVLIIGDQVATDCVVDPSRLFSGFLPHAPVKPCPPSSRAAVERSNAAVNRILDNARARWPDQVSVLRPVDFFCDTECPVVKDGILLYFDKVHFSIAGSQYMGARSKAMFRDFLAAQPPPRPSLRADRG